MLPVGKNAALSANADILSLSENFLYNIKTEQPTDSFKLALAKISVNDLLIGLPNDNARKTFWINLYNSHYQIHAGEQQMKPPKIFSEKAIQFAVVLFSLDDVEHGILRRYRSKYSLGNLPQWFPRKIIWQLAVEKIDCRIHFALNCGAKSCPPIAFYKYDKIDEQLDVATRSFLKSETGFDDQNKTVYVTKIMQWFKSAFWRHRGNTKLVTHNFRTQFQRL